MGSEEVQSCIKYSHKCLTVEIKHELAGFVLLFYSRKVIVSTLVRLDRCCGGLSLSSERTGYYKVYTFLSIHF